MQTIVFLIVTEEGKDWYLVTAKEKESQNLAGLFESYRIKKRMEVTTDIDLSSLRNKVFGLFEENPLNATQHGFYGEVFFTDREEGFFSIAEDAAKEKTQAS